MTGLAKIIEDTFPVRGRITENAPLGTMGWFKTGGVAGILFKPADLEDLRSFFAALSAETPVQTFGVLSNTIIRDGGVPGVTIRLGREFAKIEVLEGNRIRAGALALDASVAKTAADAGIAGLEFFSSIPGTIGGALRMNAGCYGTETKDILIEATALDRNGKTHILTPARMGMSYRHTTTPADYIFVNAVFQGQQEQPEIIKAHMAQIKEKRENSQPLRERTGGSTFANPSAEEIARAELPEGTKVWQIIDRAGCRGLMVGGAQMSEKHCNFMINTGTASAEDLENLGEEVRRRVAETFGITLRWEIRRIGEKA